jgi:hypothetical protein
MTFIDLHFVSMVAQHNTNSYRLLNQALLNDVVYSFRMLFHRLSARVSPNAITAMQ